MLILITGPTGAGKTTVSKELVQKFEKAANIDLDEIKHFIVKGFKYNDSPDGIAQWQLLGKNASQLIRNYLDEGYLVIVNGYVFEQTWGEIYKLNNVDYKFLLLPDENTNVRRDYCRSEVVKMGSETVLIHQNHFRKSSFYADFETIDSSDYTVKKTVEEIMSRLELVN